MADPKIKLKRSSVEGKIPTPDQVPLGEIALNTYDGYLYASKNVGIGTTVVAINPFRVGTGTDAYNAYFTAGNVGIGSEIPTTKLDVVGDAKISGVITATSFTKSGGTSSQFLKADGSVDSSTYLTSFTETNDLSSAVTWTNVPDANITESSVTQHQAALSITESQISDLQSYLTSYTETDTLDSVTSRGNSTSNGLSVGIATALDFVGGGSDLRNLSGTHLVSYASASDISNSALSISGISTYNEVGILTGSLATTHEDQFGFDVDCSADGKTIVVGASKDEIGAITNTGLAYVFDREGNNFNQVGILTGSLASESFDQFGASVSISADGKTIVVGAYGDETSGTNYSGVVYVFDRVGNNFNQVGILTGSYASDTNDLFGLPVKVSADGKNIIVGARSDEIGSITSTGVVYVFDREGNDFNQVGILTASLTSDSGDKFGNAVATSVDGKTIVVGAYDDETGSTSDTGVVYVFDREGNDFNQVGILTGSLASDANDYFGFDVDCSSDGKTIIVGASQDEVSSSGIGTYGVVYVFDREGNDFNQVGILTGSLASDSGDNFGWSVETSADGKTIIVGAKNDEIGSEDASGVVYVYKREGNNFNQVGILTGSLASDSGDSFGWSVATSADGKNIIVGAHLDEIGSTTGTGVVYVFDEKRETYLFSDTNGNIGIGSEIPTTKLDVDGTVTATTFSGSGANLTNLPSAQLTGALPAIDGSNLTGITAAGTGAIGGVTVKDQNGSTVGTAGSISTFDFNGSSGVTVTASSGAAGIATVVISAEVASDTTPQLGGNLDLNSKFITGSGGVSVTGVVTATTLVKSGGTSSQFLKADGSVDSSTYLTSYTETDPVVGAINGIVKADGGGNISAATAGTDYLTDISQDTSPQLGGDLDLNSNNITGTGNINITGGATFSGNVSVAGTLTYDDVTNIESVGLVTAKSGIIVDTNGISVSAGVVTAPSFVKTGGTSSQFLKADGSVDSSTYLTSFTETNDLSSAVTWANVPDANITESSVTQHQAALSITESQISDLQSYLTSYTETQTLDDVLGLGNTSSTGLSVGVVTATALAGYDYLEAPHGSTVNFTVTITSKSAAHRYSGSGSDAGYAINGVESPFLTLTPGRTYRFTLSSGDMSSHPFRFYLEADKTTAYTTNVTSTSTYTEIVVTDETPTVLHYQCSAHDYMGNAVQTNSNKVNTPYQIEGLDGANITGVVTATSFSGSGSALTGLTGASAATYGDSNATPVIVVDANGRITGISTVAISGGGSVSEAFKTISVSGQSDVVADSATDTLTFVAGSNMTITTNASGDSITFASSGGGGSGIGISNVVEDTTPQLGGDLDLNSNDITGTGNLNVTGIITSTTLSVLDDNKIQAGDSQDLRIYHKTEFEKYGENRILPSNGYVGKGPEPPNYMTTNGGLFGCSVAINDTKVLIGSQGDSDNDTRSYGQAYLYDHDGTNEVILSNDGGTDYELGHSVGLGTTVAYVGRVYNGNGEVKVFDFSGNIVNTITASDGASGDKFGYSIGVGTSKIVFGAPYDDDAGNSSGSAYIFNLDGTGQTKITASDAAASDNFGWSVGIGGTIVVVAAPYNDDAGTSSGSAYIFDLSGNQLGIITASDGAASDIFGWSVAVNDTKIAIGSPYDDDNGSASGSVYLYNHDGTGQTKITASDAGASDNFGYTVAFNDTKLFVGSPNDDDNGTNSGAIYVYDLDGSNEVKVVNTTTSSEAFAQALAANNSKYVVGAKNADDFGNDSYANSGAAYIFDASPQNTYLDNYTGDLTIRNNVSSDVGGNIILQAKSGENSVVCNDDGSVELYHDNNKKIETISTGATVTGDLYSSGSLSVTKNISVGDAYAFRAGNSKDLVISHSTSSGKRIVSSDIAAGDGFGHSVAIGTSKFVVGSRYDDDDGSASGSAYIYDLSGDNEVKITASDGAANDNFGYSVGIGGTIIVVTAPYNDNVASNAGQAYIFDFSGNQLGIITASDGASGDTFGLGAVAVGTSKIVVGAYNNDDAGSSSGSAYIYDHDGTNQVKITASDAGAGDNFGESIGIGGTIIVVGARYDDDPSNSGSAYIFDFSGNQLGIVTASDGAASDYFGNSVSVGGTIFVVGADGRDNPATSGAAYIFDHKGNQLGIITASDAEISAYFGGAVVVDDTTIAVGAWGDGDESTGAVYLYDHKGNNEVKITNPDGSNDDQFGLYVGVNVGNLIVGIPAYDADGENAGSAFIYNTKNINGSYIENKTGDLVVKNLGSGGKVILQATSGENSIVCNDNGSVELYYDNTKRLETISTGATVTGDLYATTLYGDGSNLTGLTGASAATYGNSSATPVITVDSNGRITGISTVATSGGGGGGGISNVVEDTTPQLGGDLDLNSNDITGTGNINITGVVTATSFVGDITGDVTGNADTATTATTATNVTVTANNSTDETVYPVFVDGATGTQGAETDTGLSYNPSSGTLTATTFSGSGSSLTGLTGASAATYGNSSATPVITVDANGRITGISTVATSGAGGGGGISNVVEDTTPQLGGNLDVNAKNINFGDSASASDDRLMFGDNNDLQIYHGVVGVGSTSYIDNNTGNLFVRNNVAGDVNGDIYIQAKSGENSIYCQNDGSVFLYSNNALKFRTWGTGIIVTGTGIGTWKADDNQYLIAGYDDDIKIYHDGWDNYIDATAVAPGSALVIRNNVGTDNGGNIYIEAKAGENSIVCNDDGSVELYYDDALKLETSTTGVTITGIATATVGFATATGTSSQFLKADGSVDSSTYLTSYTETDPVVGAISGIVKADGGGNISTATAGTDYLTPSGDGSSLTGLTGAGASTYGSAGATPVIVVDSNGRITGISTAAISGGGGGGGGSSSVRTVNRYVATQDQTLFPASGTISYSVGYLDVYLNGSRLDTTEFTATNGTTVTLDTGASANDIVELVAFTNVNLTDVTVVNDTSPQLGGDLDLNGNNITGTGNINITGTATVTGGQVATQNDAIAFAIALG